MNSDLFAAISCSVVIVLLLVFLLLICIFDYKNQLQRNQREKDFIKTLNSHDKAVICEYNTVLMKGYKKNEQK